MPPEDSELHERVAVLESQNQHLRERLDEKDQDQNQRLERIERAVETLLLESTRYKTAWGVLFMLGSAIWGVFVTFKDYIFKDVKA